MRAYTFPSPSTAPAVSICADWKKRIPDAVQHLYNLIWSVQAQ